MSRPLLAGIGTAVLLSLALTAPAREVPSPVSRPNFDAYHMGAVASPTGSRSVSRHRAASGAEIRAEAVRSGLALPSSPLHVDERAGVPTFLFAAPQADRSGRSAVSEPKDAARGHLRRAAPLYRLDPDHLSGADVQSVHDVGRGPVVVTYRQVLDGIPVWNRRMAVAMNRSLELVALSGSLAPEATAFFLGDTGDRARRIRALRQEEKLSVAEAVESAMADLGLTPGPVDLAATERVGEYTRFSGAGEGRSARAKRVWYPLDGALLPGYYVEVIDTEFAYGSVISSVDGRVLFRNDLMSNLNHTYNVYASPDGSRAPMDSPLGNDLSPHPAGAPEPLTETPASQRLVSVGAAPYADGDPWLAPQATETVGNAVDAYLDLAEPDGYQPQAGDFRADTNRLLTFDYPYDPFVDANGNTAQQKAEVVQLFYYTNYLHNWFYRFGFDEAAGNAQQDNFGRGGLGGDRLRAEAQDFSGTNNANMMTPADGASPRMQMFLFEAARTYQLVVDDPTGLGPFPSAAADFGPLPDAAFSGALVVARDATADPALACEPLVNAAEVAGRIALVSRGGCTFAQKVVNAQDAGAVGVVIANNVLDDEIVGLGGGDDRVVIPTVGISGNSGAELYAVLATSPVTVHVVEAREPAVVRGSAADGTTVAHEWGHYLSNRLVGNATGLWNNQGRSLGEGWGDFLSLLLVLRPDDRAVGASGPYSGAYCPGGYIDSFGMKENGDAFYFSIRRVPYSIDFGLNALTFRHIENDVPLPNTHPVAPHSIDFNAEVHSAGEIWATALWEAFAALLRDEGRLSFDEARDRMVAYLVAGLKLTPSGPTFTEARDALLAAAAAGDPDDHLLMAQAFARRGMGTGAVSPARDSTDHHGVVESYSLGSALKLTDVRFEPEYRGCDDDGVLDPGESGLLTVTVTNTGINPLPNATLTVTSAADILLPSGSVVTFPPVNPTESVQATVEVYLRSSEVRDTLALDLAIGDTSVTTPVPGERVEATVAYDLAPSARLTDDAEGHAGDWEILQLRGDEPAARWRRVLSPLEDGNHVYFAPDLPAANDVALVSRPIQVAAAEDFIFAFGHVYVTEEGYDGGIVEMSVNGGAWRDLGEYMEVGYTGMIEDVAPGGARPAYTGFSFPLSEAPQALTETIALGREVAGSTVRVRFRFLSDAGVGSQGWYVDNIRFSGVANQPFTDPVADRAQCVNHLPVADAGPDVDADERDPVTGVFTRVFLNGGGADGDGDPLDFLWEQVDGPDVVLEGADGADASFVAPSIDRDTRLTFALYPVEAAGVGWPDQVEVLVRQRNVFPRADAGADRAAGPGDLVTLDARDSVDLDGDIVAYRWEQIDGPPVSSEDLSGASLTFDAPVPAEPTVLTFRVTVTDDAGEQASSDVAVSIPATAPTGDDPSPQEAGGGSGGGCFIDTTKL